ncbi:hypothetical protein AJ81_06285 [Pseudothermotoga hypogea DSM 11164 = NBRC 106472]|uniref:Uncharacterized protein n=1 Tax=Pseudothermotoga hypogea DSM 11164 = NBRC 106472 TaxID=1123384 RepID=A0A0X1KTY0_9THEM|nr:MULTISPECIES: hypothetical protein [Pseudothermotoga]AJC74787.1 hypothetical protein AJ81_06285 [Pseudothermotoga hypogea DSM 11164 = NBRC 106472]MDI6863402.1 hypothetical protein [Pseudothermotoga sp.]
MKIVLRGLLFLLISLPLTGYSHAPIVSELPGSCISCAIPVKNIAISQVLYKILNNDNSFVWLTFEGEKGEVLKLDLGTPKTIRYETMRPIAVLLGPGLPVRSDLPFEVRAELGAIVFEPTGPPRAFYEPFTNTHSWIHLSERIALSETGRYYLVAYFPPNGMAGNLFVAVGTIERFTAQDIANLFRILPEIRAFYSDSP